MPNAGGESGGGAEPDLKSQLSSLDGRVTKLENPEPESDWKKEADGGSVVKFEANGAVFSWDAFKFELPSIFNLEKLLESKLRISQNDWGFLQRLPREETVADVRRDLTAVRTDLTSTQRQVGQALRETTALQRGVTAMQRREQTNLHEVAEELGRVEIRVEQLITSLGGI